MATSDRGGEFDAACRALEAALRSRLCVTAVRIRLHTRDRDIEYDGAGDTGRLGGGAKVTLLIRDALGIVGDIDVIDGCHPTCTGRAIHQMAAIVEEHAAPLRRCLVSEWMAVSI